MSSPLLQRAQGIQDQKWAQQDQDKQAVRDSAVKARSLAIGGLQQKLSTIDPQKDPGQYHELVAQIQEQVHGMREILNPDQKLGAGDWLKAHTTDWLHITNHDKRVRDLAAKNAAGVTQDQGTAASLALSPDAQNPYVTKYNQAMGIPGTTPEGALRSVLPGMNPKLAADGAPYKGTDGKWYQNFKDPEGQISSRELPPNYNGPTVNPTGDTRARADFEADTTKPPGETFETWKARKAAEGSSAGRTPTALPAQMVALQAKKALAESGGGPPLTPQESAKLTALQGYQDAQQRFQLRMAGIRGAQYNMTKPLAVFDSSNGNAPTYATFAQMQQEPGRYLPAGPTAKAMSQENLMEDLQGTSQNVRQAINNLKEDFPADMKVKIAVAMRAEDPSVLSALISSGALGALTDDQQDFLVGVQQLKENALAMRSVLGAGQGSDDVRRAIQSTLPSLLSPNKKFALKQLDAYDATVQRLHRGVPKVPLNNTNQPGTPPPGSKIIKWDDVK